MSEIEIVAYQPRWPQEFAAIGQRLRAALRDAALRIDHIGSTSVPGLPAKDLIDVQIAVQALEPIEAAMREAGYVHRPDIDHDHLPPNTTGPQSDWEKRYFQAPQGSRRTNIHVRVLGAANQRYALLFRDFLRAHPPATAAYATVKQSLAQHAPDDVDFYYAIKDPVCDVIMAAAEEWAAASGWEMGPSDA